MDKIGILLINTGTPDTLKLESVKSFLENFLLDEDIIPMPTPLRKILVKKQIIPKRAPVVLEKYRSFNTSSSPLLTISKNLEKMMQQRLNNIPLHLAMRYSSPSIQHQITALTNQGVERLIIVPLFPQFSRATTLSILKEVKKYHQNFTYLPFFYNHPLFIQSWVNNIKMFIRPDTDLLLFSYHGLPKSYLTQQKYLQKMSKKFSLQLPTEVIQHNYKQQCLLTTKQIMQELKQQKINIASTTTFQSRFGRQEWIRPYTDRFLQIEGKNFKHILIVPAAFITDGLETLEELCQEATTLLPSTTKLTVTPSLNTQRQWLNNFKQIILEHLKEI